MKAGKSITPESVIVRNSEIIHTNVDNETAMMSLENSEYYGLNPVGRRIWKQVETPVTVSELCRLLEREYNVEPERCRRSVLFFLTEMADKNLIWVQND